jgi:CDP-glycerol glycerophosphotransferase (TagB/SpsB family)
VTVDLVELKRRIRLSVFRLARVLSTPLALLPPRKGLIVFTCLTGTDCRGNPAPLYEAFRGMSGFQARWVTPYRGNRMPGHVWWLSPRGIWYLLRMEGWVIDSRTPTFFPTRGKKIFQTWHGVGIKTMAGDNRFSPDASQRRSLARDVESWSLFFTTSDYMARHFSRYLGIPMERIRVTGYPRNDVLFDERVRERVRRGVEQRCPVPFRKLILYAPTWSRHALSWWPFSETDLTDMQRVLAEQEAVWVVRLHRLGMEKLVLPDPLPGGRRIFRYDECFGEVDVQEALTATDVLVTDYSSIAYDFILLDRPMLFLERAAEEFAREQGLVDGYRDLLPGPVCGAYEEFAACLVEALRDGDPQGWRRAKVLPLFHRYADGHSTERCVREIVSVLGGKGG